jgi:preprotein translocase subunit SecY
MASRIGARRVLRASCSEPWLRFFRHVDGAVSLLGGTMFLMWLGEQITSRGIGNGIVA